MKQLYVIGLVSVLLVMSACDVTDNYLSDGENPSQSGAPTALSLTSSEASTDATILDIAAGNEDFSILAEAVLFAGLDDALSGRRQFTVFAPTNDAFLALLDNLELTPEELFSEEYKELVKSVLLYHVASGNRDSGDVVGSEQIKSLQGSFIKVSSDEGNFFVGNEEQGFSQLIDVDIFASNGVIHVIDAVMLPPSEFNPGNKGKGDKGNGNDNGNGNYNDNGNGFSGMSDKPDQTIVEIASGNDNFSILVQAVVFARLGEKLSGRRQYTVFAPTNDAFVALLGILGDDAENLYKDGEFVEGNEQFVRNILLYHVAPGSREAEDVVSSDRIRTENRSFIFVKEDEGSFFVGNDANGFAEIIATDIIAGNGVIHVIDSVMLP